jgi:hypothetical protein
MRLWELGLCFQVHYPRIIEYSQPQKSSCATALAVRKMDDCWHLGRRLTCSLHSTAMARTVEKKGFHPFPLVPKQFDPRLM